MLSILGNILCDLDTKAKFEVATVSEEIQLQENTLFIL